MSSKTKIVVLHMKEIIYTVIFAALALLLILLLVFMFLPNKNESENSKQKYIPGVYTSDVTLNNTALEVEVTVDESHINSIRFSNLDESVAAMYPMFCTAFLISSHERSASFSSYITGASPNLLKSLFPHFVESLPDRL